MSYLCCPCVLTLLSCSQAHLPVALVQAVHLLEAKIEMLRGNLTTARQELDEATGLRHEVDSLHTQLRAAGIEPESALESIPSPAVAAAQSPSASQPTDIATPSDVVDQQQPLPGQVSPFQNAALQEPGLSWIQSPQQSVEGFTQSEGLQSGLQSPEPSALFSASAVTQIQQQNAALKAELSQLTQREAAEEADVAGLQTQNRDLIAELEKLRAQVGEVSPSCHPVCMSLNLSYSVSTVSCAQWCKQ